MYEILYYLCGGVQCMNKAPKLRKNFKQVTMMNKEVRQPKRVWAPVGTGVMLARRFQVSPEWVSKALNGRTNSPTARNIRAVAVKEYNGTPIY